MAYVRAIHPRRRPDAAEKLKPVGYEVRYRDTDGRQRTKGGFRRKVDAQDFAHEVEVARRQGTLINPQAANVSFNFVADAWLRSIEGRRKPKTVDGYAKLLRGHVRPAFGRRRITSISYADVDSFVRGLEATGRRPGTVRNTFFVLKMVLDYAIKDGRLRSNPCATVDLPSPASPEMLFLTPEQVRTLVTAVDELTRRGSHHEPAYSLLVEFAAFTGLRAGEIEGLRVGDLDLRQDTVHVQRSVSRLTGRRVITAPKTKAGRRVVVLPAFVATDLRTYLDDRFLDRDAPVFVLANGRPLNYGTFYSLYFKRAVRAVLPDHLHGLRFHDLRHSYASFLVEQGAHPKEMAELMGHSSVQITLDRYSHIMPRLRSALAERLDAAYRDTPPASIVSGGEVSSLRPLG